VNDVLLLDIVERLERHRQPATYGAVAGVVEGNYRTVMSRQEKNHRNSWVVNKVLGLPTGYGPEQIHPELSTAVRATGVIDTPEALDVWLQGNA
jgi:hypothetical protein